MTTSTPPSLPQPPMGHSPRRLNRLARELESQRYLEIGVSKGATFLKVEVPERTAVDPDFGFDIDAERSPGTGYYVGTSDAFFAGIPRETQFDVVFIDGLHTFEQAYRDLCNVLAHSQPRTAVLLDDTWPSDVYSSLREPRLAYRYRQSAGGDTKNLSWHGDVFKLVFAIHDFHPYLDYRTIMGSGNPQTLVWRSSQGPRTPVYDSLEQISRLSYFDMLAHAEVMKQASEDEAIELCLDAVQLASVARAPAPDALPAWVVRDHDSHVDKLDAQIKALRTALGRRDAEIARMASSSSWRLTAPARRLGHAVRSLTRRNGGS